VVEAGDGPLVLLLHGFPQFWWTWRGQLVSLPAAGYRVAAVDLRGYGASDKPPRGYDLPALASDAAGLIRALGETTATVVGHDWGGLLAWTMAATDPKVVRRMVAVSAPHPLRLRSAILTDPLGQGRASGARLGFQLPFLPERRLTAKGAALVGRLLDEWSGPDWPSEDVARQYREMFRIPGVAHCALEYHRWFTRSQLRPDGRRYARHMRAEIEAPTLQLHGALDSTILPRTAQGSGRFVAAPYRWRLIEGAGHFPHEERPEQFDAELIGWLSDPEPDR
jgi:pimeloyl-ACP methyl ester carboxylesterase